MSIKVSITDIRSAISSAQSKVDQASNSDTQQRILESQIAAANDRVTSSEAAVTRSEMTKKEAEDKLSPPPTKQIQSDGKKGGTKTVVDEVEKDKLQAQVRAADTQITQARQGVDDAKAQAEALTAQNLDSAGVSSEQQQSMSNLSDLVSQLKEASEDPQTNFEGDEFQDKLKSAVDQIAVLKDDLPTTPNGSLKDFWKEVTEGMTAVQTNYLTATTPPAYEIATGDRADNYSQFFEDYQDGMNTLIERLPQEVEDNPARVTKFLQDSLTSVMKHSPSSPDAKYLEGFNNATDEKRMTDLMNLVNGLINNLNRNRDISDQDVTALINGSTSLGDSLAEGGTGFKDLMTYRFNTLSNDSATIMTGLQRNGQTDTLPDFDDAVNKFSVIANPNNFTGLTAADSDALDAMETRYSAIARSLSTGGTVSDNTMRTLIDDSNTLIDRLAENYGLAPTTNTSGSGTGVGTGVGIGGSSGVAGSSVVGSRR